MLKNYQHSITLHNEINECRKKEKVHINVYDTWGIVTLLRRNQGHRKPNVFHISCVLSFL